MTFRCREGHESSEPDYCSVCGAPLGPAISMVATAACPSCGEARADPDARFCEVCRYDFVAKSLGPPPEVHAAPAAPLAGAKSAWELVVTVDPSLDTDPDPNAPCPAREPAHVFDFDGAEMLVGRRDDRRDIRPEVPLHDPGSSRRHAKFLRNADGSLALQDLASLNGTSLNGTTLPAGSRRTLREGDEVTLGRWTRIRLRRKA